jgi:hypothetical protein
MPPRLHGNPVAVRRRRLVTQALEEWRLFQSILVRNLLPAGEAAELVLYVEAIVRSGA